MLLSAPGLSVVALVLFVLFGSLVAGALFPLQLLDPPGSYASLAP